MERKILHKVQGSPAIDGAGVKLVRVLGRDTTKEYDPILMLDSFDSTNPEDYIAGFPPHPHRGIETISYVYRGAMTHEDSLGNKDTITDGEVQWMTAGSGIIHSESLLASERLLGVQLWLNLSQKDKMTKPNYHAIKREDIEEIQIPGGMIRLLAGSYKDHRGYQAQYQALDYYDIHLAKASKLSLQTDPDKSIMAFTLVGDAKIGGEEVAEKTAVYLSRGESLEIQALSDHVQVLYMASERLDEPIAWAGPIVMNTKEELHQASLDLREGTFIKENIDY